MTEPTTQQLFDVWRRQLEESTQAWTRMVSQAPSAAVPDPMAFWRPVLNHGLEQWAQVFAQSPATPDLVGQWKQFLDQWVEAWSRVLGQTMGTEHFAQLMGRSLEGWLAAQAPMKRAGEQAIEQTLQSLNVASRTQLTAVARQIVELEERLERIEEGVAAVLKRLGDKERA